MVRILGSTDVKGVSDTGYLGTDLTQPIKKKKGKKLTEPQKKYNKKISKLRIKAEQISAAMETYSKYDRNEDGSSVNVAVVEELSELGGDQNLELLGIAVIGTDFKEKFDVVEGKVPEATQQERVSEFLAGYIPAIEETQARLEEQLGAESITAAALVL